MPITFEIDSARGRLRTVVDGSVSVGEVAEHVQSLVSPEARAPRRPHRRPIRPRARLVRGRRPEGGDDGRGARGRGPFGPRAIVVSSSAAFGMVRMLSVLLASRLRLEAFRDVAAERLAGRRRNDERLERPATPPTPAPADSLGLGSAAALVVGHTIAVGVFLTPAELIGALASPAWTLGIWLAAGRPRLRGALTFGELAARHPQSGGLYVYLREAFGPRTAFLYGWQALLVMDPGITAAIARGAPATSRSSGRRRPDTNEAIALGDDLDPRPGEHDGPATRCARCRTD